MEQTKLTELNDLVDDVLRAGFGEVDLKITIKNHRIELFTLTKIITTKIDSQDERG